MIFLINKNCFCLTNFYYFFTIEVFAIVFRLSNLGVLSNDKFALSSAYNMRKKALWTNNKPKVTEVSLKPVSEVPGNFDLYLLLKFICLMFRA